MKSVRGAQAVILALVLGAVVAVVSPSAAEHAHSGTDLHCNSCHVMHASKDGDTWGPGGAGFDHLLKGGTTNETCLYCHAGKSTSYPDVVSDGFVTTDKTTTTTGVVQAYASAFGGAGGVFQSDWATLPSKYAHDLSSTTKVQAVQGTWQPPGTDNAMDCADCHEPHGNENWRNLQEDPGDTGAAAVLVRDGTQVFQDPSTDKKVHFNTDGVSFASNNHVTEWCVSCHTNITSGEKHESGALASIGDLPGSGAHFVAGVGNGFGTAVDGPDAGGTSGIPRIRFGQDGGLGAAATSSSTVLCLSCHKAHGTKWDSAVLWPHARTSGTTVQSVDQTSGCDQCHDKGA